MLNQGRKYARFFLGGGVNVRLVHAFLRYASALLLRKPYWNVSVFTEEIPVGLTASGQ